MGLYQKILNWKSKVYDSFLINPKIVKYSIISSAIVFFSAIIIGYIVAQFDPDGYNILKNYISDLGSFNHTPLPYFLDYGAMITSILLIPSAYYMEKQLAPSPLDYSEFPRMRYRLSGLGSFFNFMGLLGFFMIGLFSEDRSTPLRLHFLFSHVVFAGLILSSFFYGLLILFYKTEIPRIIGLYMTIVPFIAGGLFLFTYIPFFEWIMLFTLLIWMIPVHIIFLNNINKN